MEDISISVSKGASSSVYQKKKIISVERCIFVGDAGKSPMGLVREGAPFS